MFDSLLSLLFGSYSHKFIFMRLSKLYRYGLLYDSTRRSGTEGGETAGCGLWPVPRLQYRCFVIRLVRLLVAGGARWSRGEALSMVIRGMYL